MNDEDEYWTIRDVGAIIIIILMFGSAGFVIFNGLHCMVDRDVEYMTIKGEVLDTEVVLSELNEIQYLNLTIENESGIHYVNVWVRDDIDLTVNSKIIIQFQENKYHEWFFWTEKTGDGIWTMNKIIKVPSGY